MRLLATLLALLTLVSTARADDLRPGYLAWSERAPGAWAVAWKAPLLGGLATRATPILPAGCGVTRATRRLEGPVMVAALAVRCAEPLAGRPLGLSGLERGFTDALLRVAPLGQTVQAERLTPERPTAIVAARPTRAAVAWTYLKLGVTHILAGYDHLLFVIALVLLIQGWRRLVATVTAFTLAHSLTLAAATLGVIAPARKPIEICIALSIVLLAREVLRPPDQAPTLARRAPALIAFTFGLLHGFGFAAALAEIGLPERDIPLALLTFNVGVEVGQLVIVAGTLAALAAVARAGAARQRVAMYACAYGIGAVACAWLIQRTLA